MWVVLSLLNIFFAYVAEQKWHVSKSKCKFSLFLIVFVNVIIMGLRDQGVGTDTLVYVDDYMEYANSIHSIKDFFFDNSWSTHDKGFVLLALLSTMIGNDPRILMFFTELFVMSFTVFGLYEYKKTLNISFSLFVMLWVLLYQFLTINLMRQFCAMVLLFYGYSQFLQKKIGKYVVFQIFAIFFHSTSILFVIIPIGHYISYTNRQIRIMYLCGLIVLGLLFIFAYHYFLSYLQYLNIVKDVYFEWYGQYRSEKYAGAKSLSISMLLLWGISIFICYYVHKNKIFTQNLSYMLFLVVCLNFVFQMSSLVVSYYFRISYYVGMIMIVYYSIAMKKSKKMTKTLFYSYVFVLLLLWIQHYKKAMGDMRYEYNLVYKSKILEITE